MADAAKHLLKVQPQASRYASHSTAADTPAWHCSCLPYARTHLRAPLSAEGPIRLLRAALPVLLTLCMAAPALAQTTTTSCNAFSNTLNCTSNTTPSAAQRQQQFQQAMAQLGAALAQRRAADAAQQAAWAAAATEEARQAAAVARANYDATAAAASRFAADTVLPTTRPVNTDLVLDWSLLHGVESRMEVRGEQGVRWDILRRWAFTDTPDGGKVLRMDEVSNVIVKKEHVRDDITTIRFDPATGVMLLTREGRPLYATVSPGYESQIRAGVHAFATRQNGPGFDITVPPGTLDGDLLWAAIAVIPGDLPASFRIWTVDGKGEVVPADVEVVGRKTVEEPAARPAGTCAGADGRKERRNAVTIKFSFGTWVETVDVLATAPHLRMSPNLKCRIIGR